MLLLIVFGFGIKCVKCYCWWWYNFGDVWLEWYIITMHWIRFWPNGNMWTPIVVPLLIDNLTNEYLVMKLNALKLALVERHT